MQSFDQAKITLTLVQKWSYKNEEFLNFKFQIVYSKIFMTALVNLTV
jgi:hypothetical protein